MFLDLFNFLQAHYVEGALALLALSEALAYIPAIKANGVFQLIVNGLKKLAGK